MGIADTFVILVSAIVKVVVRLRSEKRIKTMAEFTDGVTLLRNDQWQQNRSTAELLPGDVFQLEAGRCMPCDAVLLTGQVVVNESSLTGEPLPIRKFPLRADDKTKYDRTGAGKISTLFAGTTLSSVQSSGTLAMATHTGTATDKGQLIKKILFPTQVSFVFDEQIKIVILILLCCGMIVLGLAIWLYAKGTSKWIIKNKNKKKDGHLTRSFLDRCLVLCNVCHLSTCFSFTPCCPGGGPIGGFGSLT